MTLPYIFSLCRETLSNILIDDQEVLDIISMLPVNKSIDLDLVTPKILEATLLRSRDHSQCYLIDTLLIKLFLVFVKLLT